MLSGLASPPVGSRRKALRQLRIMLFTVGAATVLIGMYLFWHFIVFPIALHANANERIECVQLEDEEAWDLKEDKDDAGWLRWAKARKEMLSGKHTSFFGKKVSTAQGYICVFHTACVSGSKLMLPHLGRFSHVEMPSAAITVTPFEAKERLSDQQFHEGNALVVSASVDSYLLDYFPNAFAGLDALGYYRDSAYAINQFAQQGTKACDGNKSLLCITPIKDIIVSGKRMRHSTWEEQMLKALVQDEVIETSAVSKTAVRIIRSMEAPVCYQRVIVASKPPSPNVDVVHKPKALRKMLYARLSRMKIAESGFPIKDEHRWLYENEAIQTPTTSLFSPNPDLRFVVVEHSDRRVHPVMVDANYVTPVINRLVKEKTGVVREIIFEQHSFVSQGTHAQAGHVLISVSGGDLTRMFFMQPGTVVIQLNPFLSFTPRFHSLARSLGITLLSWTCTKLSCALGAPPARARLFLNEMFKETGMSSLDFDSTGSVLVVGEDGAKKKLNWPIWGDVDFNKCPVCQQITQKMPKLKNSAISVARHANELDYLVRRAFEHLAW